MPLRRGHLAVLIAAGFLNNILLEAAGPQVQANGWAVDHEHPKWGVVRQTATLAAFSRTPCASLRTAPLLGQHTEEVLREIGYTEELIRELRERGVVA